MNYEHAVITVAVIGVLYLLLHGAAAAEDLEAARTEARALAESIAASLARIEKALTQRVEPPSPGGDPGDGDRGRAEDGDRGRAEDGDRGRAVGGLKGPGDDRSGDGGRRG